VALEGRHGLRMPHAHEKIRSSPITLHTHAVWPHPERAVARGEMIRVRRGVFATAREWSALAPWDRYLARVHAVAIIHPDAVFSHESAAALQGLPVFRDPRTVHVLSDAAGTARTAAGIRVHITRDHRLLSEAGGLVLTEPIETTIDLARGRHPALALAVADAALRGDALMDVATLLACNEARLSSRGRARARGPLSKACSAAESPLESVSRAAIEWLGFPEPQLQVPFGDDRADFWWPHERIAGESDGDLKYDGRFGDPLELLRARRRRDDRLRMHARDVVHWSWNDVVGADALRAMLMRAGLPLVRPESTAQLASMRRMLTADGAPL
jgi:hypothetical protein